MFLSLNSEGVHIYISMNEKKGARVATHAKPSPPTFLVCGGRASSAVRYINAA
jgi:hypothetical protein